MRRHFEDAEAECAALLKAGEPLAKGAADVTWGHRAGLALPVVDSDTLTVMYPDPMALMADLRAMGETNAAVQSRKGFTRPATLTAAAARYAALFADGDGKIPATFQILTLTGWAPDASQQQPLTPGSATARLADALDTKEHPLPDKARLE